MTGLPLLVLVGAAGLPGSVAAEDCAEKVDARAFHQKVSEGDSAYAEMELEAFQAARMAARAMVPCLDEELTPAQVAGYHRMEALGSFLARDHAAAVASLRSLVAAAPGYTLSTDLAPDGHPFRLYFSIAEGTPPSPGAPLPRPAGGWVHIDGAAATERPVDRPYVYQAFDSGGILQVSALRETGALPPGDTGSVTALPRAAASTRTARVLGIVSAGSALVAGGLYLGARGSAGRFWDPSTPTEDLDALRTRTNTLGALSAGVGVVAVGTGGAALLVGTW